MILTQCSSMGYNTSIEHIFHKLGGQQRLHLHKKALCFAKLKWRIDLSINVASQFNLIIHELGKGLNTHTYTFIVIKSIR